jgi:penicillin amidase
MGSLPYRQAIVIVVSAMLLSACSALWPAKRSLDQRLATLEGASMPLEHPVDIAWNAYQVPFIEAKSDRDLAFALGVVHHHLRAGQMAVLKRISQGRLSEIAGPFGHNIDQSLRILGFGRSAEQVVASWPDETRLFVSAFVDGLNWHQENHAPPPERGLLGSTAEPWRAEDLVTIGRLAGTDVSWLAAFGALDARLKPDWPERWKRLQVAGHAVSRTTNVATDSRNRDEALLNDVLKGLSRSGSNSLAIAPGRSKSGAALIANDPHLGLLQPNLWLLVGIKSPSYHAVGMMIPGLPFVALGRSPWIAWGGTNARASSSDFVNVSELPDAQITVTKDRIRTRLWRDKDIEIRLSEHGPIISDSPFVKARPGEALALKWVGHQPTDEITAFLRAMRATDVASFKDAFSTYGVSAQNMLVVDRSGSIGKVMAAWLPRRPEGADTDLVTEPVSGQAIWTGVDTALDLPSLVDPDQGYITSANEKPIYIGRPAGFFFSPDDRVNRMAHLVESADKVDVDGLKAIQTDVRSESASKLARSLAAKLQAFGIEHPSLAKLASWDGDYREDSVEPVIFETLLFHVAAAVYGEGDEKAVPRLDGSWGSLNAFLINDLDRLSENQRQVVLQSAIDAADADAGKFDNWGEMHRVRVQHLLGNIPILGRFFFQADLPTSGSRETLMKRSHNLVRDRHNASFGAQARHISDMSDDDANWFVLFGGQDGWIGSANFVDQIELWREGQYIQLPLTPETIDRTFPVRQTWTPVD